MRKLLLLAALCAALATPARAALSTTNSVVTYTSNGVGTSFSTTYKFLNTSHLIVTKTDLSAVTTTLTLGVDYSVTGAGAAAGGTVTLNAAIPNAWTLKIKRSTPKIQGCSLRTTPQLGPNVEACLDTQEMQLQEMNDGTFTSLIVTPVTTAQASTAAPLAVPNATNTNDIGTSASFAKADHVHALAVGPMLAANTVAGQSIPSNATPAIVVFGTVERDSDSAYNSGTGRYTIPAGKGGDYLITAAISWNAAAGTGPTSPVLSINKNASVVKDVANPDNIAFQPMQVTAILNLAAGDIIDIRLSQQTGGAVVLQSIATRNFFALKRIQ